MPEFLLTSGLPSYPAGLPDKEANLVMPLYRAVNALADQLSVATGNVQYSPSEQAAVNQFQKLLSQNTQKIFVQAGEALSYGQLVSLSVSGGKIVAVKADGTILARPAHGVVDVATGIPSGGYGEIILMQGRTLGISGTTFGAPYYLSTVGQIQAAAPVATGVINQVVGMGLGSAGFLLNITIPARRPAYVYKFSASVLRVLYEDGYFEDMAV